MRAFSLSLVKINGAGHILDRPLYEIGAWVLPTLHDMVGWIENIFILLVIFLLARLAKGGIILTSMGTTPSSWSNLRFSLPWQFQLLNVVWVGLTFASSEYYYLSHESELKPLPGISLNINDPDLKVEEKLISSQITAQLHYSNARSLQWQEISRMLPTKIESKEKVLNPNQEYWQAFEANWNSGGACTAVLSTHSPAACLPLTGLSQVSPQHGQPPEIISLEIDGHKINFENYQFVKDGRTLHVFRCFWPSKALPNTQNIFPSGGYSLKGRIEATLKGRRNVGGTMLALAIANVDSSKNAVVKLKAFSNERIKFDTR